MTYRTIRKLKDEEFRRLTGVKRETFEVMAALLKRAKKEQKARGGELRAWLVHKGQRLRMVYLPSYAPNLNLIA